ncbi:alpha/beta fold hydrolase [Nocardia aurantia]|nr:alpha/beta fold hydrolase [Nocardia aurantia]
MALLVNLFRLAVVVATGAVLVTGAGSDADPSGLARFHHQRLAWKPCGIDDLDAAGAECADVLVPLDYTKPHDRTMTVAISRITAGNSAQRRGVLVSNPGGPGAEGLDSVGLIGDVLTPEVLARYDLIGMDPRGVGRSDRGGRCGWPVGEMIRSSGHGPSGFRHDTVESAGMAVTCLNTGDPAVLRQLTTRNTARDMDVVRGALGERTLNYYGVSYGTYLGAVYTQMFPARSDRMVFDSSIDPDRYWEAMVQDWGPADEAALDDWAGWAASRDDVYHFGATPAQVRTTVEDLLRTAGRQPIVIDDFLIDDHWLPFILHNYLSNFRSNAALADLVREVADDAGRPPATARTPRLAAVLEALRTGENSALAQIACADAPAPAEPEWYWHNIEAARTTQPIFGAMANNIQPCAFWPRPVETPTRVRNSVPVLLVQSTGDPRTPYPHALALHRALSGSRLVTLRNIRIHMTFRTDLSACLNGTVNTYLGAGVLPAGDRTCDVNATM